MVAMSPHHFGNINAPNAASCPMPMVATVAMSRGARSNRRMTSAWTEPPMASATIRPTGPASQIGQPHLDIVRSAAVVGSAPRSDCAKVTIWFDRHTRLMPAASSAPSTPRIRPLSTVPSDVGQTTICNANGANAGT